MADLYPSLKPLPKPVIKRPKAVTPTGMVRVETYEGRRLQQAFKKEKV